MKKLLLVTAVATLATTAANATPTVYGKAFLTTDYVNSKNEYSDGSIVTTNAAGTVISSSSVNDFSGKKTSATSLNSDSSRIGVKGAEPLTANTNVVYQLEYGIDIDTNSNKRVGNQQYYSRDTFLGVDNKKYGMLVAGRLTTIDDYINYANQASGAVIGGDNVLATVTGPRVNNAFAYFSPKYNGVQFMAMHGLSSKKDYSDGGDIGAYAEHAQYGIGVKYEPTNQPYRAGITYMAAGDNFKDLRVSGDYKINPALTVGAQYQNTDFDHGSKENAYTLSGAYKTATPWTVYAQGDAVKNAVGYKDDEKNRIIIGGRYAFTPAATGHVYGAYMENKVKDVGVSLGANSTNATYTDYYTGTVKNKSFGIGAGLEYNF